MELNSPLRTKSSKQIISNYYSALKNESYTELENIYCEQIHKFHSTNNIAVHEALKEHKRYLTKYEINEFEIMNNSIKEDDNHISFILEYSIVRKSDGKELNFILDLEFVTEGNRICSVEEEIIRRY